MPTVRNALAAIKPHVSTKAAWKETIRVLRAEKKNGRTVTIGGQSDVHRLLDLNVHVEMDIQALKEMLRDVVQASSSIAKVESALCIDSWAKDWLPVITKQPVHISISGWPDWITKEDQAAICGHSSNDFTCTPTEAATLYHHLDGLNIGGSTISISHRLPNGEILPPVPRKHRDRKRPRGQNCWLPHLDEQGRISATPRPLARAHGQQLRMVSDVVIDPFCGLGADSIGAALAGCSVMAVERNQERLELAKANAKHFGVADKISFYNGNAADIVPTIIKETPDAAVFLDPPWGGVDWNRLEMNFDRLFGLQMDVWNVVFGCHPLLLKLPRTFDIRSLPAENTEWILKIGRLKVDSSPADRVRIITALHIPSHL